MLRQPATGNSALRRMAKSEKWGIALMNCALQARNLPQEDVGFSRKRPVLEAAQVLIQARRAGYVRSFEKFRVDPDSGDLREK